MWPSCCNTPWKCMPVKMKDKEKRLISFSYLDTLLGEVNLFICCTRSQKNYIGSVGLQNDNNILRFQVGSSKNENIDYWVVVVVLCQHELHPHLFTLDSTMSSVLFFFFFMDFAYVLHLWISMSTWQIVFYCKAVLNGLSDGFYRLVICTVILQIFFYVIFDIFLSQSVSNVLFPKFSQWNSYE